MGEIFFVVDEIHDVVDEIHDVVEEVFLVVDEIHDVVDEIHDVVEEVFLVVDEIHDVVARIYYVVARIYYVVARIYYVVAGVFLHGILRRVVVESVNVDFAARNHVVMVPRLFAKESPVSRTNRPLFPVCRTVFCAARGVPGIASKEEYGNGRHKKTARADNLSFPEPDVNHSDETFQRFLRENVLRPFYDARLHALQTTGIHELLSRQNPYLFREKKIGFVGEFVTSVLEAYLSSQEETLFGNLLEMFALHVAETLWGGRKSVRRGLDLEFVRNGAYFIVEIKSGVAWGNASQIRAMRTSFKNARAALRREGVTEEIVAVNGCMYGRVTIPLQIDSVDAEKNYFKYAGQAFWHFLSGDDALYREIIVPLDEEAKQKDDRFRTAYIAKINELTLEFGSDFLTPDRQIDWLKLVEFVSARTVPAVRRVSAVETESADETSDE